jgi:predicted dehydrogenase
MTRPVRWCIVGPGAIADVFAGAVRRAGVGEVAAVVGRSRARSDAFVARHGGSVVDDVASGCALADAVYVATPHPAHAPAVATAIARGRAVLCEKPLAATPAVTERLFQLADEANVLLLEAWMYRCHPQIVRAAEWLRDGAIGRVQTLRSHFAFDAPFDAASRLWSPALAGGGILDVGGYPVSLAMLLLGSTQPAIVAARGRVAPSGVDAAAELTLAFPSGARAELRVAIDRNEGTAAIVEGELGTLTIEQPFLPEGQRLGRRGVLVLRDRHGRTQHEVLDADLDCFALEARAVQRLLAAGERRPPPPMVDREASLAIATVLAEWRRRTGAVPAVDESFGP